MGFGQVAATSQFYLYGRRHCTATGYEKARAAVLKEGPDLLDSADLSLVVRLAPRPHAPRRARRARHPPAPARSPLAPASTLLMRARAAARARSRW
eukprot:scaffold102733_cov63-Phaeocystis_antarctica.AAC.2